MRGSRKWLMLAVLAAGSALAQNKEAQCRKDCEEVIKVCIDSCKDQTKKKAPETTSYCTPKCNEIKEGCFKECENEQKKRKR